MGEIDWVGLGMGIVLVGAILLGGASLFVSRVRARQRWLDRREHISFERSRQARAGNAKAP